jgi:pyridoxal phosphate enzyme (YggS family)
MTNTPSEQVVIKQWIEVQERIKTATRAAGRDSNDVLLIAVSKLHPFEKVQLLFEQGQLHFGENKVQELVPKMELGASNVVWHMIGGLQTNKIKYLASRVDWIHSVPKIKALDEIEKRASEAGRVINALIQVNISEEDQKSGCDPEELKALLLESRNYKSVMIRGLMGMASFVDDPEIVRPQFRLLRDLRDEYRAMNEGSLQLEHLSMGMTNDLEVAIQEGSTMVRVGTAIFGERD